MCTKSIMWLFILRTKGTHPLIGRLHALFFIMDSLIEALNVTFPIMYDSFLGRGVVDAPMKAVGDFISDIGLASLWDNTLVVSFKSAPFTSHCMFYRMHNM